MTKQGSESFESLHNFVVVIHIKKIYQEIKSWNLMYGHSDLLFKQKGYWNECEDPNIEYKDCPHFIRLVSH